jgi:diphthamide biosynthesis protein 2
MERLQALCVAAGKKTYTFVMGRLNEAKLCNFPEVDIFCFISNEDVSLIPPKTFHAPVLTPWELEMGLGAREWSSSYMARPTAVLDGELSAAVRKVRDARSDDEDSSDGDGDDDAGESGLQSQSGSRSEVNGHSTALTTAEAQREGRLVEFSSPAGDFLKARDYQGMSADVPEGHSLEVHKGKVGLAASYADIL